MPYDQNTEFRKLKMADGRHFQNSRRRLIIIASLLGVAFIIILLVLSLVCHYRRRANTRAAGQSN